MAMAMAPKMLRLAMLAFALAAVAISVTLIDDRKDRGWDRQPVLPYTDLARQDWTYGLLRELGEPGDRLAIWGWSAKHWVYSGLLPATRESSTEFAMLNWGGGYYRERYLASMRSEPPEFFIEAVGPGQFLFADRSRVGMSLLPELASIVGARYVRLHDDAQNGLYMRKDVFDACCTRAPGIWQRTDGGVPRRSPPRPGMPEMDFSDPYDAKHGALVLAIGGKATKRLIVPVMRTSMQRAADVRVEDAAGRRLDNGCRKPVAKLIAGWPEICVLELRHAPVARVRAEGAIAVGAPLLVRADERP